MGYKKFKVEAISNGKYFIVLVKGWSGIWKSAFVSTNYFSIQYDSKEDAIESIQKYKNRFTKVK